MGEGLWPNFYILKKTEKEDSKKVRKRRAYIQMSDMVLKHMTPLDQRSRSDLPIIDTSHVSVYDFDSRSKNWGRTKVKNLLKVSG